MSRVFTTGQVAKLAHVAPRTVCKWLDDGRLPGYRIPGSQDRRFRRADLVEFFRSSGLPMPACFESQVLLAGLPAALAREVIVEIPDAVVTDSLLELGIALILDAGSHTIVIDASSYGRQETMSAGRLLRVRLPGACLIGLACEDELVKRMILVWAEYGFDAVLAVPFGVKELVRIMRNDSA